MASVTEPSPIKPLWPVRREEQQRQRRKPEHEEDGEEREGEQIPGRGDAPTIDDYA